MSVLSFKLSQRFEIPEKDVTGWYCKHEHDGTWVYKDKKWFEEIEDYKDSNGYPKVGIVYNRGFKEGRFIDYVSTTDSDGAWKLLPEKIITKIRDLELNTYYKTIRQENNNTCIEYKLKGDTKNTLVLLKGNTLFQAISEMLEWLLDNGYLKPSKK